MQTVSILLWLRLCFCFLTTFSVGLFVAYASAKTNSTSKQDTKQSVKTSKSKTEGLTKPSSHSENLEAIIFKSFSDGASSSHLQLNPKSDFSKPTTRLHQILSQESGIQVTQSGSLGQNASIYIRGANSEHLLVLIDGLEVNDPSLIQRGFNFANLNMENVERIEVYKGAQSARFGPDAFGGVINIITQPDYKGPPRVSSHLQAGSFGHQQAYASIKGGDKYLTYSLYTGLLKSTGFSAAQTEQSHEEKDGYQENSIGGQVGFNFKGLKASAFLKRLKQDLDLDKRGGPQGDDPNYTSAATQTYTGIHLQKYFLQNKVKSQAAYYLSLNDRTYNNPIDDQQSELYFENLKGQYQKFEFLNDISWGSHHSLQLGSQLRLEELSSHQRNGSQSNHLKNKQQSHWGNFFTYKFKTSPWESHFSLRNEQNRLSTQSTSPSSFSNWASSAYFSYAFNQGFKISSHYGTGLKPPSLFQIYSKFGSQSLKPQKSQSFDFSLEKKLFKTSNIKISSFYNNFKNLIDFDFSTSSYKNIASAYTYGFETSYSQALHPNFLIDLNYTYLRTKDEQNQRPLLRRARHKAQVSHHLIFNKYQAILDLSYSGTRQDLDPTSFTPIQLKPYWIASASGTYQFNQRFSTYFSLHNLFSQKYQQVAGYQSAPRSFLMGLKGNF